MPRIPITKIDRMIGRRIRQRRTELGLTQPDLAEVLNISCAQVQKYENGTNKIAASTLHQVAEYLEVEVGYIFEDDTSACHTGF
ncbi:helix-turn-helix domain-containing protein [Roseibium algae]|uniref:Helix-turn-helix transcriptional regulator n=1 Tax=Roseibium algae TaxID=3123038 RepID=A0ABU8TFI4_9HYPH